MKAYLKYFLLSTITLILWSCSEESRDEPEIADPTPVAEYYVKYEAAVTSVYLGNNIIYTVRTDKGSQTFTSGKSFSQTFGPVEKGFIATFTADASHWFQADCEVRIYVCRGSEPFALKAYASGGMMASTSYKIDY